MEKIPLKKFWEAMEQRLSAYSSDELRSILRAMAEDVSPTERETFLAKLKPMSKETAAAVKESLRQDTLLADIADLKREIQAKAKNAEYWEDESDRGDYYHDEDSLGPYEEFVEPVAALFDRTEAVFDYGNLKLARTAYQKLFDLLTLEDDYGRGLRSDNLSQVDISEARARYLRAVYETESLARRPRVLFEQMQQARLWSHRPDATVDDIIQISRKPLPDQAQFFDDWIAFLREQKGNDADAWLREAVRISRGTPGLEELARKEGKKRPRAYLDWFTAMEGEGKYREVLAAAQDALQRLSAKLAIRADIADHLCAAAAKLNETEALRAARWEAFIAAPTLRRLLDLWDASPHDDRTRLMRQAAAFAQDYVAHPPRRRETVEDDWNAADSDSPAWMSTSVLAHAYLLAEDWEAAHQLGAREKVLGWSSTESVQGLVVMCFLAMLSGKRLEELPTNLKKLWKAALEYSSGSGYWAAAHEKSESTELKRLERAYQEKVIPHALSRNKQEEFLAWCLDVAKRRVSAIVGEQHRGSYDKAAMLVAACSETLRQCGDVDQAKAVVDDARNHFPRHRAFQTELDAALGQSGRRK